MMFGNFIISLLFIALIAVCIIAVIYFLFVRPWILRMGATKDEAGMPMPGDGLVESPGTRYTHAITIKAPREVVWAYLIQVGYKRAGWYNWDFINRMAAKDYFYENNKSADRIIPDLQSLKEGDKIFLVPQLGLDVSQVKRYENILLTAKENDKFLVAWSYMLKEINRETTRLYVRWSADLGRGLAVRLMNLIVVEPGGVGIQQSRMLAGIKKRAEKIYAKALTLQFH